MDPILSKPEIEQIIRTQYFGKRMQVAEFIDTVNKILKGSAELDRGDYYYSRELKKIREEAFPISMLLSSNLIQVDSVEPSALDHSRYDAMLTLANGSRLYLEVTILKDGQHEKFRALHMEKFGRVPLNGISKEDLLQAITEGRECWGDAVLTDDTIDACVAGVQALIEKKISKTYDKPTALLITIEDDIRDRIFSAIANQVRIPIQNTFSQFFMVSVSSKNCTCLLGSSFE